MVIQLEHIDTFAKEILDEARGLGPIGRAAVVFLSGDLGAGKTTTVQAMGKILGIKEDITSPTFVILKKYEIDRDMFGGRFEYLIHIDAYRLKSFTELQKIKFENYAEDEKNLIIVEWPEMVKDEKLVGDIGVRFEYGDKEGERKVELTKFDKSSSVIDFLNTFFIITDFFK